MRIERTGRGARLLQDDVILSEVLAAAGPTHSLFDVLAACVAVGGGERFLMLGFAGGGVIAPLRAMGYKHPVDAVDVSLQGEQLFRELSDDWAGDVHLAHDDAVRWLQRTDALWDVIVEDLSTSNPVGVIKPYASFDELPELVRGRLRPGGIAVVNLLPLPGTPWPSMLARVAHPHARSVEIMLEEYENRIVVAGDALPTARVLSRQLRSVLTSIGSNQARKLSIRTLARD